MTQLIRTLRASMLALAAAGALAVAPAMPALAQEISPEHLALARQYVDSSDRAQVFEFMLIQTGTTTMRTLVQQNPDLGEPLEAIITGVVEDYVERKDELFNQFARIYAAWFTQDELEEIVAFYTSPTGQKLMGQNVRINRDLETVMDVWERNMQREFFARVRAELREAGYSV